MVEKRGAIDPHRRKPQYFEIGKLRKVIRRAFRRDFAIGRTKYLKRFDLAFVHQIALFKLMLSNNPVVPAADDDV